MLFYLLVMASVYPFIIRGATLRYPCVLLYPFHPFIFRKVPYRQVFINRFGVSVDWSTMGESKVTRSEIDTKDYDRAEHGYIDIYTLLTTVKLSEGQMLVLGHKGFSSCRRGTRIEKQKPGFSDSFLQSVFHTCQTLTIFYSCWSRIDRTT